MSTTNITTTSETKEWVLACGKNEQCEIESLNHDISFIESVLQPPTDLKETNSMYFLKNIPRVFTGNASDNLWIFIDKDSIVRKRPLTVNRSILGYGDLTQDAWMHQKVVQDVSLFSSAFTFNIDRKLWVPYQNGVEIYYDIDLTRMQSIDGKLEISSGAILNDYSYLMSRRHPRYQPNRGHLYSSSIFLPSKNSIGIRNFGIFNELNGAFFSLENGILYAVIRTTVNSITSEPFKEAIDFEALGLSSVDLEKGNIYDIQMQWRGVGNIKWFIGDPLLGTSKLVATYEHLNTDTELSISNPSLPVGYECINTNGTEVEIQSGCVDVTTENGFKGNRSYASATTGELAINTAELPMIAFRIPHLFNGVMNTRDLVLTAIDAYADVNSVVRVYYFRDPTAITATFTPLRDGFQEVAINGAVTGFNLPKMILLFETRIAALSSKQFTNPDKGGGDLYLTHGDNIFVTIQGKNNSLGGITLEFAEEI